MKNTLLTFAIFLLMLGGVFSFAEAAIIWEQPASTTVDSGLSSIEQNFFATTTGFYDTCSDIDPWVIDSVTVGATAAVNAVIGSRLQYYASGDWRTLAISSDTFGVNGPFALRTFTYPSVAITAICSLGAEAAPTTFNGGPWFRVQVYSTNGFGFSSYYGAQELPGSTLTHNGAFVTSSSLYGVIDGSDVAVSTSTRIIAITSPPSGQVTPSTAVSLAFSYYNNPVDGYDFAGVSLSDISVSQTLNVA